MRWVITYPDVSDSDRNRFQDVRRTAREVADLMKTERGLDILRGVRFVDPITMMDYTEEIYARAYHFLIVDKVMEEQE